MSTPLIERAAMHRHFRMTSRYEWMFWDMGYQREQWACEDAPETNRKSSQSTPQGNP